MELSFTQFITLDGVYQAPGGPQEDPSGGFTHGGWSAPYGDEDFGASMTEVFQQVDVFLLGRRTYEIFAGYWPKATDPTDPIATTLNSLPEYVLSPHLDSAGWGPAEMLRGDLVKEVTALEEARSRTAGARERQSGAGSAGRGPDRHHAPAYLPGAARHREAAVHRGCAAHRIRPHRSPHHRFGRCHRDLPQCGCPRYGSLE